MKNFYVILLLTFTTTLLQAKSITCELFKNATSQGSAKFKISANQKKKIGAIDSFEIFFKNYNNKKFEIEVLDVSVPSRAYSTGSLINLSEKLAWSLWSRTALLKIECSLLR